MKKLNVLLVGEGAAGIQMLRAIRESGHCVAAVMTTPDKPSITGASLWSIAQNLGCRVWPAEWVRDPDLVTFIQQAQVDILLNVHALYVIHPQNLDVPRLGSYNLHPGPLPRYAGLCPVSWAIYRGETTHGVTVHKMAPEVDAGPVAYQAFFEIGLDSARAVSTRCVQIGIRLMLELLETAAARPEEIPLKPQDRSLREYFGRRIPQEGWIEWRRLARQVFNFVRACDYYPLESLWGYPKATLRGEEIEIAQAALTEQQVRAIPGQVGEVDAYGAHVACADCWLLVKTVQRGGERLAAGDVLVSGDMLEGHLQPKMEISGLKG